MTQLIESSKKLFLQPCLDNRKDWLGEHIYISKKHLPIKKKGGILHCNITSFKWTWIPLCIIQKYNGILSSTTYPYPTWWHNTHSNVPSPTPLIVISLYPFWILSRCNFWALKNLLCPHVIASFVESEYAGQFGCNLTKQFGGQQFHNLLFMMSVKNIYAHLKGEYQRSNQANHAQTEDRIDNESINTCSPVWIYYI